MGDSRSEVNGVEGEEVAGFALNQDFLEYVFGKKVATFSTNVATNPGDNYMSVIYGVDVVFKDDPATQHYLVKCYPNHPGRRQFLDQMQLFEKEFFMYNYFLPKLQKMIEESGADEKVVGFSPPPFHGGNVASDPCKKFKDTQWGNENFIIMTDLRKTLDYKMGERMNGLDFDHANLVIKEMAKLHALSWAYKEKCGLQLISMKYPNFIDNMYSNQDMKDQFQSLMETIVSDTLAVTEECLGKDHPAHLRVEKILEKDYMTISEMFVTAQNRDEAEFEDLLRVKPPEDNGYNKEQWLTVTHGDCWLNNFLFRYGTEGSSKPTSIVLVDYQICREVCPTVDMAYFLFSSVRAPIRIPNKHKLLRIYHDTFLHICKELKVRPFPGFSLEALHRRFRRSEIFGFLVSLPFLKIVLKPPGESIDLDTMEEGANTGDIFATVMTGNNDNVALKTELKATVLDLYENGVL